MSMNHVRRSGDVSVINALEASSATMGMRERMARGMYDRNVQRRTKLGLPPRAAWGPPWEHLQPDIRNIWLENADAALDALMDPTEGMYEALSATDILWKDQTSGGVWKTYIRAAKEGK